MRRQRLWSIDNVDVNADEARTNYAHIEGIHHWDWDDEKEKKRIFIGFPHLVATSHTHSTAQRYPFEPNHDKDLSEMIKWEKQNSKCTSHFWFYLSDTNALHSANI